MSLTALFTGASGLEANSTALDVIGNNLANLNTTGFKSQTTGFKDLVYQTLQSGSEATATTGGVNPTQYGFGVGVGAVSSNFTQGAITPTGNPLDAGIQGNGFFVMSNGTTTAYTRAGSFAVDSSGYLVDPGTGYRVQREGTVGETNPPFQVAGNQDIKVPYGSQVPGVPTANVTLQGNVINSLPVNGTATASIQIYDTQSTARELNVTLTETAANTYSVSAAVSGGTVAIAPGTTITFDANGYLNGTTTVPIALSGFPSGGTQTVNLNLGSIGSPVGVTQFGGTSSTFQAAAQDGTGSGTLQAVSYDSTGNLIGQFSNGATQPIAQLAIASFSNNGGLTRMGSNYFTPSAASGVAIVGTAGSGGLGTIQGAALEGTNVDVATEFANLIIAQRGFQVNSKTITVADQTLQTLVNIIQ